MMIKKLILLTLFFVIGGLALGQKPTASKATETLVEEAVPIFVSHELPMFNGRDCTTSFQEWCQNNLHYPSLAAENGIQGKICVSFVIEANGKLTNPEVARSGGSNYLDQAVLDVISQAPAKWTPAKINGRPVALKCSMTFTFLLEQ